MTTGAETIGDRYELGPVIGRGAMAEVHTAEDLRLSRPVAIKLLHPSLAEQPDSRLRFEDEARAAARLSDRNVVATFDTGDHLGRPYIVMELLPGLTLRDELAGGPLSEARARELMLEVLLALVAAHDAGLIHRDIKPGNILLTASGEAKVADFGIAKGAQSNDLTATGAVVGTPSYIAPECVTGGSATVASDLYAVGVVFYEALSGHKPFIGENAFAICHAICTQEPPALRELRPDLSAELVTVVATAMAKDPEARYRSARDMMDALDTHASGAARAFVDEPTRAVGAVGALGATGAMTAASATADPMATEVRDALVVSDIAPPLSAAANRGTNRGTARALALTAVAVIVALLGVGLFLNLGRNGTGASTDTRPSSAVTTTISEASTTTRQPTTTRPTDITAAPVTAPSTAPSATTPPTTAPTTTAPPTTSPPTTTPPTTAPATTSPPTTTAETVPPPP